MHKKKSNLLLIIAGIIILFSFFYAMYLVSTQIVFGFDQARDAYDAYAIWHDHHLKIMGPSSDIPGVNHGVLWYYVLAIAYFLGGGLPERAVYFFLFTLYACLPLLGYFTYKMSKNIQVTVVSLALYAMSPLYISFSHWLSNPTLSLFIAPVLFYFLWQYLHEQNTIMAFLIGLFYGLLIQSDFGFIILLLTIPVYYYVFRIRFVIKHTVVMLCGLFIGTVTFLISYIKFHNNIIAIISHFLLGSAGKDFSVASTAFGLIDNLIKVLTISYLPLPQLVTFFVLLYVGIAYRKIIFATRDPLLSLLGVWLLGILFLFIFNHGVLSAIFLYGPFLYPMAILFALIAAKLITNSRILSVFLICIALLQFVVTKQWSDHANSPLSVQQGMTINYEREVIDYVYQSAQGKPFVIITITNPLSINTTWSYLFDFYGKPKYGYVPYLWGKDQTGYLGDLPMQQVLTSPTQRYLILEPSGGIDPFWVEKNTQAEDLLSDKVEEKQFGEFIVQKRIFHPDKKKVSTQ